jgi:DNA-binding transcriptional MocR family regulator
MHKVFEERRTVLTTALKRHCGDLLELIRAVCGLHLTALVKGDIQATAIAA